MSQSRYGREGRGAQGFSSAAQPRSTRRPEADAGFIAGGTPTTSRVTSRAEGVGAYTSRRKQKGRGRVIKGILITLAVFVVGVAVAAGAYILNINNNLQQGVTEDLRRVLEPTKTDEPFYMLLLGVDKSEGRSEEWGDDTSNFRSDTIMLVRVDPPAQKVTLVSIPRDTQVDMGEHGSQKINAAYSYGGASYMVEVVEDFAGVNISHYAEIDFEQFTSIVDTIGGIEVTLPVAVKDLQYANIDLPAGTQTLNGEQALGLVRSRHAYDEYGGGDFYRAANQRMVVAAIVKKVLQLDPVSMTATVSELASSVTTDFSVTDIVNLAMQFSDFDTDTGFYSGQTPTNSVYENDLWWEYVDEDAWAEMMARVEAGESPYSSEDQDFTAGIAGSTGTGSNISEGSGSESESGTVTAAYTGSVLVLNSTDVTGLARNTANTLVGKGFTAQADSVVSDATVSRVYYNSSHSTSAHATALGVAETLGISEGNVVENDGTFSTDYDAVVVLCSDLA